MIVIPASTLGLHEGFSTALFQDLYRVLMFDLGLATPSLALRGLRFEGLWLQR